MGSNTTRRRSFVAQRIARRSPLHLAGPVARCAIALGLVVHLNDSVDVQGAFGDPQLSFVVRGDNGAVAEAAVLYDGVGRGWWHPVATITGQRSRSGPSGAGGVVVVWSVAPGAATRRALAMPGRSGESVGSRLSSACETNLDPVAVEVTVGADLVWHWVAFFTRQGAAVGTARQVSRVRADTRRGGIELPREIWRRGGIVIVTVTGAALWLLLLDRAIDVQRRVDEAALFVDDLAVTGRAVVCSWVR